MKIEKNKSSLRMLIIFAIILNIFAHFLQNIIGIGNVYYVSYFCWIVLFVEALFIENFCVKRKQMLITLLMLVCFLFGAFWGMQIYEDTLFDLHRGVFICIAYIFSMGTICRRKIETYDLYAIMRIISIIGVLAAVYAFIYQGTYAINVIKNIEVEWNSWFYTSFFSQRNIYGEFCFLVSIACLYNYVIRKKKIYLLIIIIMGIEIYIINSRGALLAYILLLGLTILFFTKKRWLLIIFGTLTCIGIIIFFDIQNIIIKNMGHTTSMNIDSGIVRVLMWKDILIELFNSKSLVFGFGLGTTEKFLFMKYGVGSSHNAYIDLFFEAGLVYILILLYAIVMSIKSILKSEDLYFRNIYLAGVIAFLIYGIVEAGMSLFCSNFFSVMATLMFVFVPRVYKSDKNILKML